MLQRPKFGYDPASRQFAMAVGPQKVRLWDLEQSGQEKLEAAASLDTRASTIVDIALTGDDLVTVHQTGLIIGWSRQTLGEDEKTPAWQVDTGMVISAAAYHRGQSDQPGVLAVGGVEGQLLVIRPGGEGLPKTLEVVRHHDDQVEVIEFSGDDGLVATAARDRTIGVWSMGQSRDEPVVALEQKRRLEGMGGWALSMAFSEDRRRLVSGCMDNGIYLWDLEAEQPRQVVRFDHHGWVEDVGWTDGDETVLSAGWDNAIGVYSGDDLQPRFRFRYHDDYVVRLVAVEGTSLVFAASYDGDVTVWDFRRGRLEAILEGHTDWVTGLMALDDELVVSLSSDRTARVWSVSKLELVTRLGESMLEGFDLGGAMDLSSFGLDDSRRPSVEEEGPDLEKLQSKVVQRFEPEDAAVSTGAQDTAMAMLEEALDESEEVDADYVDTDDQPGDSDVSGGLGEELSSLVRDAISDVEHQQPAGDESSASSSGDRQVEIEEEAPASMPTQKMDLDFDDQEQDDQEDESQKESSEADAMDLLDVPEMETAGSEQLDGDLETVRPQNEFSEREPEEESPEDEGDDEFVGIMDSVFDTESPSADSDSEEQDPTSDGAVDEQTGEPPQKSDGDQGQSSEDEQQQAPGAEEGPRPMGPDDDVGDLLPDEDEFELAFSNSVGESDDDGEPEEQSEPADEPKKRDDDVGDLLPDEDEFELAFSSSVGQSGDDEPDQESKPADESKKRDVDRGEEDGESGEDGDESEEDDDESGGEESAGKFKPPSAGGRPQGEAGGGRTTKPGKKTTRDQTVPGAPLRAPGTPRREGESPTAGRTPNETLTPFTSPSTRQQSGEPEEDSDSDAEQPDSPRRSLLERLARNLDRRDDADSGSGNAESSGATEESTPHEEESISAGGEVTKARSEADGMPAAVETDEIDAQSVAVQDREPAEGSTDDVDDEADAEPAGGFSGSDDDVGAPEPVREPESGGPERLNAEEATGKTPGLKGRLSRQQRIGAGRDDENAGPGQKEATAVKIEQPVETGDGPGSRLPDADTRSRLVPGESVDRDELNIPEPDDATGAGAQPTRATESVRQVDWQTLWERGRQSAPMMGVLRRQSSKVGTYRPLTRLETTHQRTVAVALSSKQRLVTAGQEGAVTVYDDDGARSRHFQCPKRHWVETGFFKGERFLFGVDRRGRIELWLLPETLDDDEQPVQRGEAGAEGVEAVSARVNAGDGALLVGSRGGTGYLWRLDEPRCVARLEGHQAAIRAVAFGQRGPITAGEDGAIRFWTPDGLQIDQIGVSQQINELSARDGVVMWVEASGAVCRIEEGESEAVRLQGHYGKAQAICPGPADSWLTGGEDGRILVHRSGQTEPHQEIQVPAPVNALAVQGKRMAAASPGGVVYLFERKL